MKTINTRISQWELLLIIGIGFISGWIAHMTIRNQFEKPITVENLEMRTVRVKVNGERVELLSGQVKRIGG